jgi:hypothetical protein
MISNFIINPQSGTVQDSKNVSLTIKYWTKEDYTRIRIENVSNKTDITFLDNNSIYFSLKKETTEQSSKINLNVSPDSSQATISLFVFVENKEGEEYKTTDIQSVVYYVKEESIDFPGELNITPSFVGPKDACGIYINANKSDKYFFSINDKRYMVLTNEEGKGSLHFKGNDFLSRNEEEIVKRFPVSYYSSDSNFTKKIFSGLYVHYLPDSIKAAVDTQVEVDPRCATISSTGWVPPDECLDPPDPEGTPCITPNIPPGPPTKDEECDIETIINTSACRIGNADSTLLYNGLTLHSFVSVDNSFEDKTLPKFNVPRVFISKDDTSLNIEVIAQRDVVVGPKTSQEEISIYVDEDLWNLLDDFDNNNYKVIFYNEFFGFQSFSLTSKTIDPYRNLNIIKADTSTLGIQIDNFLFCISAVFYNDTIITPDLSSALPFITGIGDAFVPVICASIGSNSDFVGETSNNIAYVVAEAFVQNESQLFLYSFVTDANFYLSDNFGWFQLTELGNNKNPKVIVDTVGNLHVFWESDRSGTYQIYYGILGPSFISRGNAVLSTSLDKHAELLQKEVKPFLYFDGDLLVDAQGSEYEVIPEFDTSDLIDDNQWLLNRTGGGSINTVVTGNRLEDLSITVNPISESALAFITLEQDLLAPNGLFDQFNYQIDFDILSSLNQSDELLNDWDDQTLTNDQVDNIFDVWKSKFTVIIDDDFSNVPIYTFQDNQFILGRKDNIYDAIIPVLGVYKESNPSSATNFEIQFMRENETGATSNVRHFVLAFMLEKSVFKAANAQFPFEYCSESGQTLIDCEGYIASETHTIYTGKAKLALLLKNDNINTSADDESEYMLVREFPQEFSIHDGHSFNVMVNYSKMFYEDTADFMDQLAHEEFSRFICSVRIKMDNEPIFGESFVVDMTDRYRKFDIAFGVPSGGGYIADKMIPNKLSVFDGVEVGFNISNVEITSPKFVFNSSIVTVPTVISDEKKLFSYDNNDKFEDESVSFIDNFNFLSLAFDDEDNVFNPSIKEPYDNSLFLQVPLTFEGINTSPSVSLGKCNDVHLTWQSNRDKYWNIYYTNSLNRGLPFRLETQITNTESNSISPSVSVNQNGNRMVVWHDNRNGNYEIFCARSLEGYICTEQKCKSDLFDNFGEKIETCSLTFSFYTLTTGLHHFGVEFYTNNNLTDLFKTVSTEDNTDGWTVDGEDFSDLCVTTNSSCDGILLQAGTNRTIVYDVQNTDGIFNKILYYKLVSVVE